MDPARSCQKLPGAVEPSADTPRHAGATAERPRIDCGITADPTVQRNVGKEKEREGNCSIGRPLLRCNAAGFCRLLWTLWALWTRVEIIAAQGPWTGLPAPIHICSSDKELSIWARDRPLSRNYPFKPHLS